MEQILRDSMQLQQAIANGPEDRSGDQEHIRISGLLQMMPLTDIPKLDGIAELTILIPAFTLPQQ